MSRGRRRSRHSSSPPRSSSPRQSIQSFSSGKDEDASDDDLEDMSCFETVAPPSRLLNPSTSTTPLAGPSNAIPVSSPSEYIPPGVFVTSPSPPATPTHPASPAPPCSPPTVRDVAVRLQDVHIAPHALHPGVINGVVAAAPSGPFSLDWDDRVPWISPANPQCMSWYVVTVGRRVGVFDNSEETTAATLSVPRSISHGGYLSREDDMNAFHYHLASGTVRVVQDQLSS
ncbi:hypothetical protein OH77DRAFT_1525937 [Trametes cingulata]|nr:hypothetical protein OH77DRAFT_1525937 [Trametes cingulata]